VTHAAWRCFVGVPPSEEVRALLRVVAERWRADPASSGFRDVPPERWHLTLAFLGDLDRAAVPTVADAVRKVATSAPPIDATLSGVGAFPTPRHARVVWVGLDDPSGRLAQLVGRLRRSLAADEADPYRPHLTLARARRGPADVRVALLAMEPAAAPVSFPIDRLELVRSHPGPSPRYETLAAFTLGAVAARA
jgi:RNA 2',3'-cyclic 3'-phosphodiesterase